MKPLRFFMTQYATTDKRQRMRDGTAAVYWAMVILLLPLSWILAMVIAAWLHEMGHYLAVRLCGRRIHDFKPGLTGAVLETGGLSLGQELFCAVSGPVVGLLPLLCRGWAPKIALCALLQSAFNLIPVYPLDGGRIMRCIVRLLRLPEQCSTVFGWAVLCILGMGAIYGSLILRLGLAPLIVVMVLVYKAVVGKRPCKQAAHWI